MTNIFIGKSTKAFTRTPNLESQELPAVRSTMPKLVCGFTVIELMVSVAIVGAISAVVIFNYSKFNDNISLSSATQEIAVAIREAQTYGLSVKETSIGSGQFGSAYGIYFELDDPSRYFVFADLDGSNTYDVGSGCGSGSTECIERFTLRNGARITSICDATDCPPQSSVKKLNIVFLRPNPDALIYFTNYGGQIKSGPSTRARIILTSTKGNTVTVTVESTGQVLTK